LEQFLGKNLRMSFGVESYRAGSVFDRGCADVWLSFGSLFVSL